MSTNLVISITSGVRKVHIVPLRTTLNVNSAPFEPSVSDHDGSLCANPEQHNILLCNMGEKCPQCGPVLKAHHPEQHSILLCNMGDKCPQCGPVLKARHNQINPEKPHSFLFCKKSECPQCEQIINNGKLMLNRYSQIPSQLTDDLGDFPKCPLPHNGLLCNMGLKCTRCFPVVKAPKRSESAPCEPDTPHSVFRCDAGTNCARCFPPIAPLKSS